MLPSNTTRKTLLWWTWLHWPCLKASPSPHKMACPQLGKSSVAQFQIPSTSTASNQKAFSSFSAWRGWIVTLRENPFNLRSHFCNWKMLDKNLRCWGKTSERQTGGGVGEHWAYSSSLPAIVFLLSSLLLQISWNLSVKLRFWIRPLSDHSVRKRGHRQVCDVICNSLAFVLTP